MPKVTLDEIKQTGQEVFDQLPDVNTGGCCVYASRMAQALQGFGVSVKCVVSALDDKPRDLNKIRAFANPRGDYREWKRQGVYFDHVLVEFELAGKRYYHDAENTTAEENLKVRHGYRVEPTVRGMICEGWLEIDEALALAAAPAAWNPWFDRRRGIPIIESAISHFVERTNANA